MSEQQSDSPDDKAVQLAKAELREVDRRLNMLSAERMKIEVQDIPRGVQIGAVEKNDDGKAFGLEESGKAGQHAQNEQDQRVTPE